MAESAIVAGLRSAATRHGRVASVVTHGRSGLGNSTLKIAQKKLKPGDFFLDQHRHISRQMISMVADGQAIDLVTLTEVLHRNGKLEACGSAAYALLYQGTVAGSRTGSSAWTSIAPAQGESGE